VTSIAGVSSGTVQFLANGKAIGNATLDNTGKATLTLSATYDANGNQVTNTTLAPGTYSLTCQYGGTSDFAPSTCAPISFTVLPVAKNFSLIAIPCAAVNLYQPGTSTPGYAVPCGSGKAQYNGGTPLVYATSGGSTNATIFMMPSNTLAGTLSFSCSGLPAGATCTFSPSSITLTAGNTYVNPIFTDVTFWTNLKTASAVDREYGGRRVAFALAVCPFMFLGMAFMLRPGRANRLRGVSLMALAMIGLTLTGCGNQSAAPVQTPAGIYPITITVSGAGISATTLVDFQVK